MQVLLLGNTVLTVKASDELTSQCSEYTDSTGNSAWLPCNSVLCWALRSCRTETVVELCCGVGLPSAFAARMQCRVFYSDAHEHVLLKAAANMPALCKHHPTPVLLSAGDVKSAADIASRHGPFALVIASEPWWHRQYDPSLTIYNQAMGVFRTAAVLLGQDAYGGEALAGQPAVPPDSAASTQRSPQDGMQRPSPPAVLITYTDRSIGMRPAVERACRDSGLSGAHAEGLDIVGVRAWAHLDGQDEYTWMEVPSTALDGPEQPQDQLDGGIGPSAGVQPTDPAAVRMLIRTGLSPALAAASPWEDVRLFVAGRSREDVLQTLHGLGLSAAASEENGPDGSGAGDIPPGHGVSRAAGATHGSQTAGLQAHGAGGLRALDNPMWKPRDPRRA